MYLGDLHYRLKKLNQNLSILVDRQVRTLSPVPSYPLVLYFGTRGSFNSAGKHYLDAEAQKFIEMKENGQNGEYMCGVSDYTPEYDQFHMVNGSPQILMRGWRSLVLFLVKKNVCSLERAKKIFSTSLGEYDYDNLSYEQKLKRFLAEVQNA